MRYPVAAPDLSGNELEYVTECISSTWISSNGRFIQEFEQRVAEFTGVRHAVAMCNGTCALHAALLALGVQPGDEVIVPTLTYVATANAVSYCGAMPVFADCEPDTWCLSPGSVERLITPRTRGIIPVHLYGHACRVDALSELAERHGLWILEDNAEAIGGLYRGRPLGSFGAAAVLSFFGNKIVTTGEGGMVLTLDPELAQQLRLIRGQGMDPARRYWHPMLGYNYRMTNVAAAIGVAQMERIERLLAARRRLAGWYDERLRGTPGLSLPVEQPPVRHAYWMYAVLVDEPRWRDSLMADLAARGIETRPFFYPVHTFPMYREHPTDAGCPLAVDVSARGLCLPTASYLREQDVDEITDAVKALLPRFLSDARGSSVRGAKTRRQRRPTTNGHQTTNDEEALADV